MAEDDPKIVTVPETEEESEAKNLKKAYAMAIGTTFLHLTEQLDVIRATILTVVPNPSDAMELSKMGAAIKECDKILYRMSFLHEALSDL